MKNLYIDESGDRNHTDVFVMAGPMIDNYKLSKAEKEFKKTILKIRDAYSGSNPGYKQNFELKTSDFINGNNKWSKVDSEFRKNILRSICEMASSNGGKIYGLVISFENFDETVYKFDDFPFESKDLWLTAAMFIVCLVQKKMQKIKRKKGNTELKVDDNKKYMPRLSKEIHHGNEWFNGLCQVQTTKHGKTMWKNQNKIKQFDQIIDCAHPIDSHYSVIVQVADAISYVYRRHFELKSQKESWVNEKEYFEELFNILESARQKIGRCPNKPCVHFYEAIKHSDWRL